VYDPSDPAAVLAVLDWELSTLGDPLADLAYNCLPYHMPEASVRERRGRVARCMCVRAARLWPAPRRAMG
jgi:aminoglycoside phosphotransferase (APT) family kinase protein